MESSLLHYVVVLSQVFYCSGHYQASSSTMPEFYAPLENITATQGRDVQFTCVVNHLGEYRVAWIKSDSKAILAIHNRLVAHNPRLSVTHNGHNTWKLHISNIQKNDSGSYMCQINTDPMRWQLGFLNVTIPPDILNEEGFSDGYQALEGGSIHLRCRAIGEPEPEVSWKREDGKPIVLRSDKQIELRDTVISENLTLSKVNRSDMGNYLCLAKSSIPPIVSKKFNVKVNFKPQVQVQNHYVGAPAGKDVRLHCKIEASPRATFQWINNRNELIMPNPKVHITERMINEFATDMDLVIKSLEKKDFGEYTCLSENTIGRAEGKIRLSELTLPETSTRPAIVDFLPKIINELPKIPHKHHVKVTKSPQHYQRKTSKHFVPMYGNEVIADISSTSISGTSGSVNHVSQSVVKSKDVIRIAESANDGMKPFQLFTQYEMIIFYYILKILRVVA